MKEWNWVLGDECWVLMGGGRSPKFKPQTSNFKFQISKYDFSFFLSILKSSMFKPQCSNLKVQSNSTSITPRR